MSISPAIELMMKLAAKEVIAARGCEICPAQMLAGLLKLSEFPVPPLPAGGGIPVSPAADLAAEIAALQQELSRRGIKSRDARRELRRKAGVGSTPFTGGQLHRSAASRAIFAAADRLVSERGRQVMTAPDLLRALLESPDPVITAALGNKRERPPRPKPADRGVDEIPWEL